MTLEKFLKCRPGLICITGWVNKLKPFTDNGRTFRLIMTTTADSKTDKARSNSFKYTKYSNKGD